MGWSHGLEALLQDKAEAATGELSPHSADSLNVTSNNAQYAQQVEGAEAARGKGGGGRGDSRSGGEPVTNLREKRIDNRLIKRARPSESESGSERKQQRQKR